jgi:nucleotide-binding universal stress UspA family protein
METIQTILHPTDFSDRSASALRLACSLARDQGARLVLVHVIPSHQPAFYAETDWVPQRQEAFQEDLKRYQEEMRKKLSQLQVPDPKVPAERVVKEGHPASVILHMAQEIPSDLIVMGTHGRTGRALVMGSVAEEVSRKAPCPVVTVKIP